MDKGPYLAYCHIAHNVHGLMSNIVGTAAHSYHTKRNIQHIIPLNIYTYSNHICHVVPKLFKEIYMREVQKVLKEKTVISLF